MSESADTATAGPAKQVQSAGVEHGYPHGHLNHLNEQEETALKNFKLFLAEKQLYKPGPPPSHDDQTLLWVSRASSRCASLLSPAALPRRRALTHPDRTGASCAREDG